MHQYMYHIHVYMFMYINYLDPQLYKEFTFTLMDCICNIFLNKISNYKT